MMRRRRGWIVAPQVLALAACSSLPPAPPAASNATGSAVIAAIEPTDALAAGRELAGRVLSQAPLLDDEVAQRYINRLGRWLTLNGAGNDLAWRFGITDQDELAALSAPGGVVLVSRGLLVLLETEDEVAAILAQSISHIGADHHRVALDGGAWRSVLEPGPGTRRQDPVHRLLALQTRGFEPEQVFSADRMAARLLARSGYDAYALPAVLAMLASLDAGDPRVSAYLASLPASEQRIERLQSLLQEPLGDYGSSLTDPLRWPRIRASLLQASR